MKKISVMTYEERVKTCMQEAGSLINENFYPEIDNIDDSKKTIGNILFKVLIERDSWEQGHIKVHPFLIKRAEKFMGRWSKYLEREHWDERENYIKWE